MTVDALVAKSLSVFDEIANAVLDEWKFSQPEVTVPWFRGQRNATCPLLPKFHRLVCRDPGLKTDCESELREELQLRASLLVGARPRNDWAWYVLMQHNGAATRLLDWTEASHVALYFAVSQHADSCDHVDSSAAVFALDPYELNRCVLGESYVYPVGDPLASKRVQQITRPWLPSRFEGRLRRRETCAVSSPHLVPRMAVQRSCFTVAGSDSRWLERRGNQRFLHKIEIPAESVAAIRRQLEVGGVDESTVFPDLDGLGRALTHKWLTSKPTAPHESVYTRIKPSRLHGVGVFAIQRIPKGARIFAGDDEGFHWIPRHSLGRLSAETRRLYDDFAVIREDRYGCPRNFNLMTVSWYLNESRKPNVRCDANYDFFATTEIRPGEELTVDYASYSDPPYPRRQRGHRHPAR